MSAKQERSLRWKGTKWAFLIGAWAAMIMSLNIESVWAKEIWSSVAAIGFLGTLGFYVADI